MKADHTELNQLYVQMHLFYQRVLLKYLLCSQLLLYKNCPCCS